MFRAWPVSRRDADPADINEAIGAAIHAWHLRNGEMGTDEPPAPEEPVAIPPPPEPLINEPVVLAVPEVSQPLDQHPSLSPTPFIDPAYVFGAPRPIGDDGDPEGAALLKQVIAEDVLFDEPPPPEVKIVPLLGDTPAETEVLAGIIHQTVEVEPYRELTPMIEGAHVAAEEGDTTETPAEPAAVVPKAPVRKRKAIVSPPAYSAAKKSPVKRRSRVGAAAPSGKTASAKTKGSKTVKPRATKAASAKRASERAGKSSTKAKPATKKPAAKRKK